MGAARQADEAVRVKALTVWQPWASVLVARPDLKPVEHRTWAPPKALLGELVAIHAAKRPPKGHGLTIPNDVPNSEVRKPLDLPLGAVVGIVRLCDALLFDRVDARGHWRGFSSLLGEDVSFYGGAYEWSYPAQGEWLWQFADHLNLLRRPIPAKGRQGLWDWEPPDDVKVRL